MQDSASPLCYLKHKVVDRWGNWFKKVHILNTTFVGSELEVALCKESGETDPPRKTPLDWRQLNIGAAASKYSPVSMGLPRCLFNNMVIPKMEMAFPWGWSGMHLWSPAQHSGHRAVQ